MDIQPQSQQPISDDQELAKVLAGVNGDNAGDENSGQAMSDIAAPTPPSTPPPSQPEEDKAAEVEATVEPAMPPMPGYETTPELTMPTPSPLPTLAGGELDGVKQEALNELRPLVDKLNVSPEEKFDTYLLLIRSTDDKSLVAPAHEAAKGIADEARRAQALLDIIKEIDFLSHPQQ